MAYFVMTPLGEVPDSPSMPRQNQRVGSRAALFAMGVRGLNDSNSESRLREEVGKIVDAVGSRLRGSQGLLVKAGYHVTKTGIGQWSQFRWAAPVGIGMDASEAEAAGMDAMQCRMPYGDAYSVPDAGQVKIVFFWVTL